jgi:hypothetical protein
VHITCRYHQENNINSFHQTNFCEKNSQALNASQTNDAFPFSCLFFRSLSLPCTYEARLRVDVYIIKSNRANFPPNEMSNCASTNDMPYRVAANASSCVAKVTDTSETIFQPPAAAHNARTDIYLKKACCMCVSFQFFCLVPAVSHQRSLPRTHLVCECRSKKRIAAAAGGRQATCRFPRSDDHANQTSRIYMAMSKKSHSVAEIRLQLYDLSSHDLASFQNFRSPYYYRFQLLQNCEINVKI